MSGGGDGLVIDEQAVERAAGRLPIERGRTAAHSAARLPSGSIFGTSPAGSSLAETWRLAAEHHRLVTTQLQEDLVALRDALTVVLDNTAESEAESSSRYARAAEQYTTIAEERSEGLTTMADEFVEANESEVADEVAQQASTQTTDAEGTAPGGAAPGGEAADGRSSDGGSSDGGGTGYGPSTASSDGGSSGGGGTGYGPSTAAPGPASTGGTGPYG